MCSRSAPFIKDASGGDFVRTWGSIPECTSHQPASVNGGEENLHNIQNFTVIVSWNKSKLIYDYVNE